ncbi:MAG TPA: type II toxin-antitoxin system HicB family antitoxin [Longimicrobium sp.]|uniref:type II toxin-antitoxin system HicB family antitoxin n=1 Tax=Longimicrobium sp. TaxID=2029185 RepID=UPI002ED814CA
MLKYEIILYWSDLDQVVIAEVPELPGCKTHGDTYEEALAMAQEAMQAWMDVARETGRPVPEPKGRRLMYA